MTKFGLLEVILETSLIGFGFFSPSLGGRK